MAMTWTDENEREAREAADRICAAERPDCSYDHGIGEGHVTCELVRDLVRIIRTARESGRRDANCADCFSAGAQAGHEAGWRAGAEAMREKIAAHEHQRDLECADMLDEVNGPADPDGFGSLADDTRRRAKPEADRIRAIPVPPPAEPRGDQGVDHG